MDRERRRTAFNRLMCTVAVLAIGFSGWTLWEWWDRRHTVDSACAGLVPAGKVLALSGAGGEIAVSEEIRLDEPLPQACVLRSGEAAETRGRSSGTRQFFIAEVATEPTGWTSEPVDDGFDDALDPSNPFVRVPLVHQPLGGGIAGEVTDNSVAVRLPCTGVEHRGKEITAVRASATLDLMYHREFAQDGQLRQADRDRLAAIATATADNLAAELGCPERLPEPPEGIPALNTEPARPDRAKGTCAWYGRVEPDSSGWLPDRVLESRTDALTWQERCLLAVSEDARSRAYDRYADDPAYRDFREEAAGDFGRSWWLSAESFFGDAARRVSSDPVRSIDDRTIAHGTGGYDERANAWWATSVCEGEPAVHVLTASHPYHYGAARHLEPVFRAYVEDVAERRGCTDVVLPRKETYAEAG